VYSRSRMGFGLAVLLWLATLDPCEAAGVAAGMINRPDLGAFLRRTAEIESRCAWVGRHDSRAGRRRFDRLAAKVWRDAVRVGWLEPDRCPGHRPDAGPWATTGGFGAMPAYTHRHLGALGCAVGPWSHAVPIVAALAAAGHAASMGRPGVSHEYLRLRWAGGGNDPDQVLDRWHGRSTTRPTRDGVPPRPVEYGVE
jgi:hypothetical protein